MLTASVVPRPIAWISTVDAAGNRNLAPHSYYNACSTNPPIVHFTQSSLKDTMRNVFETGEFVVNVVSHELGPAMRATSASFAPDEDEFVWAEVGATPSTIVQPPRVTEAMVAMECKLRQILFVGEGRMAFGDIVRFHVSESVWRDGRIDFSLLKPVGRLGGGRYATIEETYRLDISEDILRVAADHEAARDARLTRRGAAVVPGSRTC